MSRPLLVVSPHLDDGVLACGEALAANPGSVVVTVFAGPPPAGAPLTGWDRDAGFRPGDDAIGARRAEDARALRTLDAAPRWLDFADAQYGAPPPIATLADALAGVVAAVEPPAVLFPLGLFHADHARTAEAALAVRRRLPAPRWIAYAEPLYRRIPGLLAARLGALEAAGLAPRRLSLAPRTASARKRRAVACYASQLRALATPGRPGHADAFAAERYWTVGA